MAFIVLEGGEGCGKSSIIKRLKVDFPDAVFTREPGGTPLAEQIRGLILSEKRLPLTEAYLFATGRADHVNRVVRPAISEGKLVISDRYLGSSIVYQGYQRGLGVELVKQINEAAIGKLTIDLNIVLDVDPKIGLQRTAQRGASGGEVNHFDKESLNFHEGIRRNYLSLQEHIPNTVIIDASGTEDEVYDAVLRKIRMVI